MNHGELIAQSPNLLLKANILKVNVAVYKELFLELASGHVTIVTRVRLLSAPYRRSTCFG